MRRTRAAKPCGAAPPVEGESAAAIVVMLRWFVFSVRELPRGEVNFYGAFVTTDRICPAGHVFGRRHLNRDIVRDGRAVLRAQGRTRRS